MRNYLLLFLILVTTKVFPGVLSISYNGQDVSGKTVTINGTINDESLKSSLSIHNSSGSAVLLKVRKTEITTISGTQNSFCLGECYPPMVFESPNPLMLSANSTTGKDLFYAEYYPHGNAGLTEIKYEVYEVSNSINKVFVIIIFNASAVTGIEKFSGQENHLTIFPNPVKHGFCELRVPPAQFQSPLTVEIIRIDGNSKWIAIRENKESHIRFSTDSFSNGMYVLSLYSKGELVGREKLIIQQD